MLEEYNQYGQASLVNFFIYEKLWQGNLIPIHFTHRPSMCSVTYEIWDIKIDHQPPIKVYTASGPISEENIEKTAHNENRNCVGVSK